MLNSFTDGSPEPGPSLALPLHWQRHWALLLRGKWDVVFHNISSIKTKCSFQKKATQIRTDMPAPLLYISPPQFCEEMSSERGSDCPKLLEDRL